MLDRIAATIKKRRMARGESLRGLASLVGCDYTALHRWERGECAPSAYYCRRLERLLGWRPGYLASLIPHPARACNRMRAKGQPHEQLPGDAM